MGKDSADETALGGGGRTAVARQGGVVLRETGPWATAVHALLHHLDRAGFEAAPRPLGFDARGRERLSFIPGEIVHPRPWGDEAVIAFGHMLRRLHDLAADLAPPPDASWRPWFGRELGRPDTFGHCDCAPWNIVWRDGRPALIDWETAGPVDRLTELALAAWTGAQLYDDDLAVRNGLGEAAQRFRQVRLLADAYGLSVAQRRRLPARILDVATASAADEADQWREGADAWGLVWRARSAGWLVRHRAALDAALA